MRSSLSEKRAERAITTKRRAADLRRTVRRSAIGGPAEIDRFSFICGNMCYISELFVESIGRRHRHVKMKYPPTVLYFLTYRRLIPIISSFKREFLSNPSMPET